MYYTVISTNVNLRIVLFYIFVLFTETNIFQVTSILNSYPRRLKIGQYLKNKKKYSIRSDSIDIDFSLLFKFKKFRKRAFLKKMKFVVGSEIALER